jgi:hypothetical protein
VTFSRLMKTLARFFLQLALAVASLRAQEAVMFPGQVVVTKVSSAVTMRLRTAREMRVLNVGDKIGQGATIATDKAGDGRVVLVFSNGAVLSLAPDTVVRIDQFLQAPFTGSIQANTVRTDPSSSKTELTLIQGEVMGKTPVLHGDLGSTFVINLAGKPIAVAANIFRISLRPNDDHSNATQVEIPPRTIKPEIMRDLNGDVQDESNQAPAPTPLRGAGHQ